MAYWFQLLVTILQRQWFDSRLDQVKPSGVFLCPVGLWFNDPKRPIGWFFCYQVLAVPDSRGPLRLLLDSRLEVKHRGYVVQKSTPIKHALHRRPGETKVDFEWKQTIAAGSA